MLPPDLARLGDDLLDAARRTTARRAQRRRITTAVVTGALAFAAVNPAPLGKAHRDPTFVVEGFPRPGCDHPRGARFTMAACEPRTLRRPEAWH